MAISISSSIAVCLKAFNEFIEDFNDPNIEQPERLYVSQWQDELGRLRMWAANIGAHQTGQSSLDYRLRDSSHIRQQIIKLLDEIVERLKDVRNAIEEGEDEDVESLDDSSSETEGSGTEIQQLRKGIAIIIDCLFQMSMLVRKPAQHDLRVGSRKADVAAFEFYDDGHVRNKYPKADEALVSRLSHAITRRRMYLKYRERHAMKLKQGIDKITKVSKAGGTEVFSETIATDVQSWNINFDDTASESGLSQTSYAATLMSGGAITIPAPPRASQNGMPFECPYCYYIITIQSTRSWNRHVFKNLQPYVCTEMTCSTPEKLYATRHEWLHHLQSTHGCKESGETASRGKDEVCTCVLCGESQNTIKIHNRHMARHMQELALFVLPRNDEKSDSNYSNEPDSESELASSASGQENQEADHSHLPTEEDEEYVIRCLCGIQHDDGNIVFCNGCGTWQHIECYYHQDFRDGQPPDVRKVVHSCIDCDPRPFDTSGAILRQRGRFFPMKPKDEFQKIEVYDYEETEIEKPYPRKGKTRIPRTPTNRKGILLLGYSFDVEVSACSYSSVGQAYKYQEDTILISAALFKQQIDEIIKLGKETNALQE